MQTDRVKLYSRCCLAIKKRVFYCPSVLQTHTKSGCRVELELRALAPVLWDKRGGRAEQAGGREGGGDKRLCWNLSKANNHSGVEEEYYIRAPNQYHITLSMGVYTRLIKLIIFDATMALSFAGALDNNYCSITGAVCELKERKKKKYNKTNGYLFD